MWGGDRGGERDDGGVEGSRNQCRVVGLLGMECCQRFVSVDGGAEVLDLVVPAPVVDAGDVECAADLCVYVSGDEVLVVMPGGCYFGTGANADLVGDCPDSFPYPESVVGADDAFVGYVDLHIVTCPT